MTSDAKIGLLLGLVFIFMIAFLINGLPRFRNDTNNNELTTAMVSSQNNALGIGTREREVINRRNSAVGQRVKVEVPPVADENIRFKAPLPKSNSVVKETVGDKSVAPVQPLPAVEEKKSSEVKPSKRTLPKVYVVKEGDNLAVIAQKYYGSEDGNKRINITKIFEANRKLLKSPDEIYVGQRLIIPPLSASRGYKSKIESVFSTTMFKKVESIGKRHLVVGSKAKQGGRYVVRDGDSLWRIAAEQLGDGARYTEIAELNADILDDEDSIIVGMRLKLPVR